MTEAPKNIEGEGRDPNIEGRLYRRRIKTLSRHVSMRGISERDRNLMRERLDEARIEYGKLIEKHPEAAEESESERLVERLRKVWTAEVIEPKEKYL